MILATFKAGLVAAIFMHLKQEKMTIWKFLLFTAFFCTGLFLLTFASLGRSHFWHQPFYTLFNRCLCAASTSCSSSWPS